MTPPTLWRLLSRYFALDAGDERRWWQALRGARWSKAATWRQQLDGFERLLSVGQTPDAITAFIMREMPPAMIVAVVEALVVEGQLRRRQAARIEERILQKVRPDGQWS